MGRLISARRKISPFGRNDITGRNDKTKKDDSINMKDHNYYVYILTNWNN